MSHAYYNEHDPFAAAWLRNLIAAGHICPGDVDERDIRDVLPSDLDGYAQCHFFAGIGGWPYALRLAGWPDDRPVWTGSCPCQPFSAAGSRAGFADERHLWPSWHHLIRECGPATIFGEQVASGPAGEWCDLVQDDLEALGYAFGAVPLPAASVGAPHIRDRLWFVADANGGDVSAEGLQRGREHGQLAADGGARFGLGLAPGKRWTRFGTQSEHIKFGQAGEGSDVDLNALFDECEAAGITVVEPPEDYRRSVELMDAGERS